MINQIIHSDCFDVLKNIPDSSIDLILTDPPYGLSLMGKDWDHGVPGVQFWIEALRVAKPGAHLFAFGGTRTFHRLAAAIEDAGWEIRDTIMWVYGSGFPKSLDVSKAIDKMAGANREVVGSKEVSDMRGDSFFSSNGRILVNITAPATEDAKQWQGWGTALKPALEPITVARKPLTGTVAENVLQWGTGGINIDGCRVECEGKPVFINGVERDRNRSSYDTGGSNRTGKITTQGRWPANFIHDGSEEVVGLFPSPHGAGSVRSGSINPRAVNYNGSVPVAPIGNTGNMHRFGDSGSAARFFYCAKASKSERSEGNTHPTVKPLALMKYLITLGLPPGGIVLDPFCGSGTTALACKELGRNYICIEKELEYYQIACNRLDQPIEPIPDEPIEEPVDNSPLQLKLF
jgi:site-specific DNA-methyltransferase (adenine-specific)